MSFKKRTAFKSAFIIAFVLIMLGITRWLSFEFTLPQHESLVWVMSGSVWAFIASSVFDRYVGKVKNQKRKDDQRMQLQTVLKELGEIKSIINK